MKKESRKDVLEVVLDENLATARIGGVEFPIRDGWDYDGSFSARSGRSSRRIIFVLRKRVTENGYAGKNYRRGVVWSGEGYMDCTYYPHNGTWKTNDEIYEDGGYADPLSPMTYVEKWEGFDLVKS